MHLVSIFDLLKNFVPSIYLFLRYFISAQNFIKNRERKSKFSMFLFIPSYPSNTLLFLTESHNHKMN